MSVVVAGWTRISINPKSFSDNAILRKLTTRYIRSIAAAALSALNLKRMKKAAWKRIVMINVVILITRLAKYRVLSSSFTIYNI